MDAILEGPRSRQSAKVAYCPHDDELGVLPPGATDEERKKKEVARLRRCKKRKVDMEHEMYADHPKLFPPSARTPAKIIDALSLRKNQRPRSPSWRSWKIMEEESVTAVAASSFYSSTGAAVAASSLSSSTGAESASSSFLTHDDQEVAWTVEGGRCNASMIGRWEEAP